MTTAHFVRIWYQSFVHPTEQAPYIDRLQAFLDKAAGGRCVGLPPIGARGKIPVEDIGNHAFPS